MNIEHDTPYCGGDCLATGNPSLASIPAASEMFFPDAANFEAFIVPGAGHGLNLEYSHPLTYSTILEYLKSNGLGASGSSSGGSSTATQAVSAAPASAASPSSAWASWNTKI